MKNSLISNDNTYYLNDDINKKDDMIWETPISKCAKNNNYNNTKSTTIDTVSSSSFSFSDLNNYSHETNDNIAKRLFSFNMDDDQNESIDNCNIYNEEENTYDQDYELNDISSACNTPIKEYDSFPNYSPVPIVTPKQFQLTKNQKKVRGNLSLPLLSSDLTVTSSPSSRSNNRPMPDQTAFDTSINNSISKRSPLICPPTPIQKPSWKQHYDNPCLNEEFEPDPDTECKNSLNDSNVSHQKNDIFSFDRNKKLCRSNSLQEPKVLFRVSEHIFDDSKNCVMNSNDNIFNREKTYLEMKKLCTTFFNNFEFIERIGSGQFAEVYKMRSHLDNSIYAIKKTKRQFRSKRDRSRLLREIKSYEKLGLNNNQILKCTNIIHYYQAWQENGYFYTQTELCELGNLRNVVQNMTINQRIPENIFWCIIRHISTALDLIHQSGVIHLDIKPENIFISKTGIVKIGDFGAAVIDQYENEEEESDPLYMANEILNDRCILPSADIFSFGIMLFELATGSILPQEGFYWHDLRENRIPTLPSCYSNDLDLLIRSMMNNDPYKRPTALQILNHNVFKSSNIPSNILQIINT